MLSGDGEHILASNHALTLLSGYTRMELEEFPFSQLIPGETGQAALAEILRAWERPDCHLQDIPLRTREGSITLIDLDAYPTGPNGTPLLLVCNPSLLRQRRVERQRQQQERVNTLVAISSLLLEDREECLEAALELGRSLLGASVIGLYRVSPTGPDYLREGPLPEEFPALLPTNAIDLLRPVTVWSLGSRTEHVLQKSARAAGLQCLRTSPLGSSAAWIGVLVAGWRDQNDMPDEAGRWMAFLANICHAILLWQMQLEQIEAMRAELAGLRAQWESQFRAAREALLTMDEGFHILQANPAACSMLGYLASELQGMPVHHVLVGPRDVRATLLDAVGHDRVAELARLTLHRRDGTPFPARMAVYPFPEPAPARLLVAIEDLSEKEALADQREMLTQRALLGEVTAIFAHEVRNPINNISTGIQVIASRLGKDHPQHGALGRIREQCDRLNQLLSDVLFFARPLELRIEPLDLAAMIERLLDRWAPRFHQAGIECHTEFDPHTPLAMADARTLEQVVLNLITNALQAMGEGGTLSLTLSPIESSQGKMVELKVADTGPGIPKEVIGRIFDPFFTTKKEGTGLGLAISRRIMVAHKGSIDVESYPDAGTVFTLRVPAKDS